MYITHKPIYAAFLSLLSMSSVLGHTSLINSQKIVRTQIATAYGRLNASMSQANSSQFISVLKDVTAPGKMRDAMLSGAEAKAQAGGDIDLIKTNALRTTILSLSVNGNTAIATVEQYGDVIRRDSDGQYGPARQNHRIIGKIFYRDTWQRIGTSWKLANEIALKGSEQVDGKTVSSNDAPK